MGLFLGEDSRTYLDGSFVLWDLQWTIITAAQHGVWAARSGVRVCKSCRKTTESDEQLRTAQLLMELMGDSQSMPMNNRRGPPPNVIYTARQGNKEEKVELETMNML